MYWSGYAQEILTFNVFDLIQFFTLRKLCLLILLFEKIHGGMFHINDGASHGAEYFMDEDVVLVTLNYRLGAFGMKYFEYYF